MVRDLCHDATVLENLLWLLTGLAGVVVLLTRMRLSAATQHAGRAQIPQSLVTAHTVVGVLALAAWVVYLVTAMRMVGVASVVLWWVEVLVGLGILARWLPSSGDRTHAADAVDDTWTSGPALSVLGHVGLLLGAVVFTFAVVADKVA